MKMKTTIQGGQTPMSLLGNEKKISSSNQTISNFIICLSKVD